MTPMDLMSKAIPGVDAEQLEYVLWNRTPFPFDARPRVLFKKADGYRRACINNIALCEFCSRPARRSEWTCTPCHTALSNGHSGSE